MNRWANTRQTLAPHKCCVLWNNHNGAWRKTRQFLRDATEQKGGKPALTTPPDNQQIRF
jgi:hypothetical protein